MNATKQPNEMREAAERNAAFYSELNAVTYARRRGEITKDESKAKAKKIHAKYYGK